MKRTLAVFYGQAPQFSTSFQTRELARHLEPWFNITHYEVPTARARFLQQFLRLKHNLFTKIAGEEFVLYGNDGLCNIHRFPAKRILYWYDAPKDWSQSIPANLKDCLRCQNVRLADHVFAVSAAQVAVAKRLRLGRESTVHYLPVGVDCKFFDPSQVNRSAKREEFGFCDTDIVVGYLGYLGRWKNRFAGEALLEAAPLLKDLKFLVIGSGPAFEDWRRKVSSIGMTDRFVFTGFVPQAALPGAIAAADICVDTLEPGFHSEARSETKLKQYMAMGRACVATDIGENRVDLQYAGVLVAPNATALAAGIRGLALNPGDRERFGVVSRARAIRAYSWAVLGRQLTSSIT